MATIIKRLIKGKAYYYAVESARVDGKPRIVRQKYLGTVEKIEKAMASAAAAGIPEGGIPEGVIPEAEYAKAYEFGAVVALFDIAERIGVRKAVAARLGLRAADAALLAAINLAVGPVGEGEILGWLGKTVLYNQLSRGQGRKRSVKGFWEDLGRLDGDGAIGAEDDMAAGIVQAYGPGTDCLIFYEPNLCTHFGAGAASATGKPPGGRAHGSGPRAMGLSLMVFPAHDVPLLHEPRERGLDGPMGYTEMVESLGTRCERLGLGDLSPTLVLGIGDDLREALGGPREGAKPCHVVAGLSPARCPELTCVPKTEFMALGGKRFPGLTAIRSKARIYGNEYTAIVTHDPGLFESQLAELDTNIVHSKIKLEKLKRLLAATSSELKPKSKKITSEVVFKGMGDILSSQYMDMVFERTIKFGYYGLNIDFSVDEGQIEYLKENYLGKSVIVTDRDDWPTERIVAAYQYRHRAGRFFRQIAGAENYFPGPGGPSGGSPFGARAFTSVLSLRLLGLLRLEMERLGHELGASELIGKLGEVRQIVTVFPKVNNKSVKRSTFCGLDGIAKDYIDYYGLTTYAMEI
ncbi:MAG: hypothetical protein LBF58_01920 [Deltaproteobacteria bacterium]|nr:hypothetical protein [Deltaproteobacteria bacterium]